MYGSRGSAPSGTLRGQLDDVPRSVWQSCSRTGTRPPDVGSGSRSRRLRSAVSAKPAFERRGVDEVLQHGQALTEEDLIAGRPDELTLRVGLGPSLPASVRVWVKCR